MPEISVEIPLEISEWLNRYVEICGENADAIVEAALQAYLGEAAADLESDEED